MLYFLNLSCWNPADTTSHHHLHRRAHVPRICGVWRTSNIRHSRASSCQHILLSPSRQHLKSTSNRNAHNACDVCFLQQHRPYSRNRRTSRILCQHVIPHPCSTASNRRFHIPRLGRTASGHKMVSDKRFHSYPSNTCRVHSPRISRLYIPPTAIRPSTNNISSVEDRRARS